MDYCCGDGSFASFAAKNSAEAKIVGIDISEASIETGRKRSLDEQIDDRLSFLVIDGENLAFHDASFDVITCMGALHHLDIERAYSELVRVLKPHGEIICVEPLAYNPLIQLYRRMTPSLRTKWETEHILTRHSIKLAKKYFGKVETRFFGLATLAAAPLHHLPGFSTVLNILELVDDFLLRLPILRWYAWQIVLVLSQPKPPFDSSGSP